MSEFQLLTAEIMLGGDIRNVVVRDRFEPVTYPEYLVLMILHGEGSVKITADTGEVAVRDDDEERKRLAHIYGKDVMQMAFPGVAGALPTRKDGYAVLPPLAPAPAPEPAPVQVDPAPAPVQVDPVPQVDPAVSGGVAPITPKKKG